MGMKEELMPMERSWLSQGDLLRLARMITLMKSTGARMIYTVMKMIGRYHLLLFHTTRGQRTSLRCRGSQWRLSICRTPRTWLTRRNSRTQRLTPLPLWRNIMQRGLIWSTLRIKQFKNRVVPQSPSRFPLTCRTLSRLRPLKSPKPNSPSRLSPRGPTQRAAPLRRARVSQLLRPAVLRAWGRGVPLGAFFRDSNLRSPTRRKNNKSNRSYPRASPRALFIP